MTDSRVTSFGEFIHLIIPMIRSGSITFISRHLIDFRDHFKTSQQKGPDAENKKSQTEQGHDSRTEGGWKPDKTHQEYRQDWKEITPLGLIVVDPGMVD